MGVRFRKSIKLSPGTKLNINKKSTSITFGTRGAHHTINSSGIKTTSVGLPGSGLSYTTQSYGNSFKPQKKAITLSQKIESSCLVYKKTANIFLFLFIAFVLMSFFYLWCIPLSIGSLIIYFLLLNAYYDKYINESKKILNKK